MDAMIFGVLENLPTIGLIAVIFVSLGVLGRAADYLVDQAVTLSVIWGIPKVVVGATIVSLGTTIPEVTVSVMAALDGNADLALGNAIGSIITNTTLILGLAAIVDNLKVDRDLMKKQGSVLLGSVLLLTAVSLPIFYDGGQGRVTRFMGVVFLIILVIYMYMSMRKGQGDGEEDGQKVSDGSIIFQLIKIFIGIIFVIISSKVLIPSVEITAMRIGIPESVIAATLVAFGTSVPELMTSLTAVRKGHGELAVGNVIGANILNILFVVGLSATISTDGLLFPSLYFKLQVPMMLFVTVSLIIMGLNEEEELQRKHGLILFLTYLAYLVLNYIV